MDTELDDYIKQARECERRSAGLWAAMNGFVRSVLETHRRWGKSLDDAADALAEAAGKRKEGEPA